MWLGMWPDQAIYLPWDVWVVTWLIAALWTNRTVNRPDFSREWFYRVIALAGFALLLWPTIRMGPGEDPVVRLPVLFAARYWSVPPAVGWAMVAVASLGFAFAWWARIHLGRLWSGRITRKEGHRVIDTGPYAIVRHPI